MFSVFLLCGCFVWANCLLKEVELPEYLPPSQDLILSKYFKPGIFNRNKKSIGDEFQKGIASNLTRRERFYKNALNIDRRKPLSQVGKVTRLKVSKRFPPILDDTTTVRYPTATYSVERYEKLKALRRNLLKRPGKPSQILTPPLFAYESPPDNSVKVKRGQTKWKDTRQFSDSEQSNSDRLDYRKLREEGSDFLDKYIEEALMRYLMSLDLNENLGNVSVKTFTEMLKNVTREPRKFSGKREFRGDIFSTEKNENKSDAILENSIRRRSKDYKVNEEETSTVENAKTLLTETVFPATTAAETILTDFDTETTTIKDLYTTKADRIFVEKSQVVKNESEVKLSVAETVYYRKRHFPVRSLIIEQDNSGVIPGVPEVDYPMYSNPPSTGFKCPNMKGSKKPRMMADTEARCQVFYICTGDGPAAAMLCPNGTMFNENVLVCDWWYNVDC